MPTANRSELRDLLVPLIVVAIVGIMILPLPSAVLDVLLMCNISFSILLIVSAVYLSEPERFTVLPTVLLLSAVFRLGLNISTTRQLLGSGSAPEIVVAFGNFVVAGNLVVGIVIFSIISIVQFLVIAKGAERVAEVAARFTLDAMPGKQMSIDADIRSGILTLDQARRKRRELASESKLFGALDGAMKFVKGDAIAGLLITVINITAGLFVGVTQQGLSFSDALHKYTIFTVGDGLVSQIPALLVAVAAGVSVTRVSDVESGFFSRDLIAQLGKEPQVLASTAFLLFLMAFMPGLPSMPFLILTLILILATFSRFNARRREERLTKEADFYPQISSGFIMHLSKDIARKMQEENSLLGHVKKIRNEFFKNYGVIIPSIQFEIDSKLQNLSAQYVYRGSILREVNYDLKDCSQGVCEMVAVDVADLIRNSLVNFIDDTHTRQILDSYTPFAEDLVNSVVPEMISVTELTVLLRGLLREDLSIKELGVILQAIAEFTVVARKKEAQVNEKKVVYLAHNRSRAASSQRNLADLLTEVRIALGRYLSGSFASGNLKAKQNPCYILAPRLDHLLAEIAQNEAPIEPEFSSIIIDKARELELNLPPGVKLIIISTKFARSVLAEILFEDCRMTRVIAVEEINGELPFSIIGDFCAELNLSDDNKIHTSNKLNLQLR